MMATDKIEVLCYGDSNTWGCIGKWVESDEPSARYDADTRWPTVAQKALGEKFHIIEEGLGGRTTIYPHPTEPWKNGELYFTPCLHTHRPLDLVVIMLGTNDLQLKKDITAEELPVGISRLVDIVHENKKVGRGNVPPKILLIAPIEVCPSAPEGRTAVFAKFRCEIGQELSLKLPGVYKKVAEEKGCYFLNAQDYAQPGPADGVHFDAESHIRLGHGVASFIRNEIYPDV